MFSSKLISGVLLLLAVTQTAGAIACGDPPVVARMPVLPAVSPVYELSCN
ncbi:hypothetical protein C8F04DRAFT_1270553 [Mycena alexandri]|uniref:Uncharacterized protein n=1 Tax=Mycena alexandri TaxID=1745969 RepID=A0AAD6SAY0_9AGAR|nr:hypothetical protein C8F04DRAFT_1270553 [Mycena alexandri]